jgi:4-amino-4-deoxy-L-arabinose transferase-like glycosyltransferase
MNTTSILSRYSVQLLLLLVICSATFFPQLGHRPADLMEARNFITAREIIRNNNWLVPTLNGVPRIAKPPLPTWITAGVYRLIGQRDDNGLLRLPAALMGVGLILSLWGLVRCITVNDHLAFVCAAIAATSFLIMEMGRTGSWDIYCHSFMLFALWFLAKGWKQEKNANFLFLMAGILMACSFMSKGPVAFYALLLPFILAYGIAFGVQPMVRKLPPLLAAVILGIFLCCLWPMWIYLKLPQIFSTTVSTEAVSWLVRHRQPIFFYAHFPLFTGLWAFYVIAAIFFAFARERVRQVGNYRFIILWGAISLFLLTIVPEKKERYLLPTMIPTAILAGHLVYAQMMIASIRKLNNSDLILVYLQAGLTALAALAAPVILFLFGVKNNLLSTDWAILWSGLFLFLGGLSVYTAFKKSVKGLFGAGVFLTILISLSMRPSLDAMLHYTYAPSATTLWEVRRIEAVRNLPFFALEELNPKEIWAVGKMVRHWDVANNSRPTGGAPLVLLSTRAPANALPPDLKKILTITPIGEFSFDPKNLSKRIQLVLLRFH